MIQFTNKLSLGNPIVLIYYIILFLFYCLSDKVEHVSIFYFLDHRVKSEFTVKKWKFDSHYFDYVSFFFFKKKTISSQPSLRLFIIVLQPSFRAQHATS